MVSSVGSADGRRNIATRVGHRESVCETPVLVGHNTRCNCGVEDSKDGFADTVVVGAGPSHREQVEIKTELYWNMR